MPTDMNASSALCTTLSFQRIGSGFQELDKVETLTLEAFPPEERVPAKDFLALAKKGLLDFWALRLGDAFAGYLCAMARDGMAYLSYLALISPLRGRGLGSAALQALRRQYSGCVQIVDLEPLDESAANSAQRLRRRNFYLKNGYRPTGWFLSYSAGTFELLCACGSFDRLRFQALLTLLQHEVPEFHPILSQRDGQV